MFGWLSRQRKTPQASASDAADRLIREGNDAEDAGELARACELYRAAIAAAPRLAKAHLNLGVALEATGDSAAARASYERALALDPQNAAALYNLGKFLFASGAHGEAERHLRRALELRADFPEARIVHGYALHALGRLEDAASELKSGLRARPDDVAALATLFHVLERLGDAAGAAAALQAALRHKPDWTEAHYNYATTLLDLKRDAEAEQALRRALELDPRFRIAYRVLGSLLHREGRIEDLLAVCRTGREALPDDFELESFELFGLLFSDTVSEDELFERHRRFGARLERMHPARFSFARRHARRERLRIGYVSGDLTYHPVALFILPVLERHDRSMHDVYCYATMAKVDDFTARLKHATDVWRDAAALSDGELAERIHADEIDVLVDLAGHSGISRLATFAAQPAPVQVSWLGYLNTTGLTRIQYRISDAYCDPASVAERRHTETIARLPGCQWCYRPFVDVPPATSLPAVRNGHVTFGSFNQVAKITASTRRLWTRILQALPDATLLIAGASNAAAQNVLRADFERAGLGNRIAFAPFLPVHEYLALYNGVDIALDPLPYSGGTTTCDALWMGVPVLTLPGERSASRSAGSVLSSIGLDDWIATSADDYVARAVRLAGDTATLAALRTTLRARMRESSLTDEVRFTRELEALYRQMWQRRSEERS